MPSEGRGGKKGRARAKPILRMNPMTVQLPPGEAYWQVRPPKGWEFDRETTYCNNERLVYLCMVKKPKADKDGE